VPLRLAAAGVASAWVFALLAHLAHADVLTLLLVVAGTGYALRSGGSVLDRLVLSLAVLAGLACATTLLWSYWPWRLHPAVLGGTALSAIAVTVVVSAAGGRAEAEPATGRVGCGRRGARLSRVHRLAGVG